MIVVFLWLLVFGAVLGVVVGAWLLWVMSPLREHDDHARAAGARPFIR